MRTAALAAAAVLAAATPAAANGRFPASNSITFVPGDPQTMYLGVTFGLLGSRDGGATWRWTCEVNVGYSGTYDPVYAASPAGTLYATTYDGLSISRDGGCSFAFAGAPLAGLWISDVTVAEDGAVWAVTASGGLANDVFVSRDDGMTFGSVGLVMDRAWWKTVRVAPSDPQRVYVSGYQLEEAGEGSWPLLYRSDDGGANWTSIPVLFHTNPVLLLLGVSATDPDLLFARIDGVQADSLVRSTDGGLSFTTALTFAAQLTAFAGRADGTTFFAGALAEGVRVSHDGGASWQTPAEQPVMACAGERPDGVLFACGANWNPDRFALGRSVDGETWEKVFRFVELAGDLECPAASSHGVSCAPLWPAIATQFGIGVPDAGPGTPDAAPAGADGGGDGPGCGGCAISLGLAGAVALWPRRRGRRAPPPR